MPAFGQIGKLPCLSALQSPSGTTSEFVHRQKRKHADSRGYTGKFTAQLHLPLLEYMSSGRSDGISPLMSISRGGARRCGSLQSYWSSSTTLLAPRSALTELQRNGFAPRAANGSRPRSGSRPKSGGPGGGFGDLLAEPDTGDEPPRPFCARSGARVCSCHQRLAVLFSRWRSLSSPLR